ncbi:hypothetical protein LBW60_16480 [Ralstonia solanacearum]|uniref:hypothetical protein n=1 Tax=Ralstonia solanacearum TaxID=305 RepID=UPI001FFBF0C8|nr:hypothetical protein [Ralstonia solanacearum]MDB0510873.1 hypothetical protein [Ralstonia solanacearum]MDB0514921.1 hypothetical protein [Ralstonia solanacearum]
MKKKFRVLPILLAAGAATYGTAARSQSITFDPTSGDYTISYYASDDSGNQVLRQTVFVPSTKIRPAIRSEVEARHDGSVVYRYALKNGANAPQAIQVFTLDPVIGVKTQVLASGRRAAHGEISTPQPWTVLTTAKANNALRVVWRYPGAGGLWPTQAQPGFGFESTSLPGIVAAGVAGNAPDFPGLGEDGFDSESTLGQQLQQLVMHDYVDVWVAAPAISLTNPINPTAVLTQLREHVAAWQSQKLIDQSLAAGLDSAFQAALAALAQGNTQQAVQALRAARQSISLFHGDGQDEDEGPAEDRQKEYGSKSSALAARVLQFDLRYLVHRLSGNGDI